MKRLIIVLGGLAVLVYAASAGMQWLTPRVEEDLANRVNVSLAEQGLLWADVNVEGRKVTLSGVAPTGESRDKALAAAARVFGVERVTDGLMLADDVTPSKVAVKTSKDAYSVTLTKSGDDIALTGNVPDQQSLDVLSRLAVTHYGAEHVSNSLVVKEANAPAGWRSATGTVLFNMTNLEEAEATLSGNEIMISGTVVDVMFEEQISNQLSSTLPQNYKLALAVEVVTPTAIELTKLEEVAEEPVATPSETTPKDTKTSKTDAAKVADVEPAAGDVSKATVTETKVTKAEAKAAKAEVKAAEKASPTTSQTEMLAVETTSATGILARVEAFMNGSNLPDIVTNNTTSATVADNSRCDGDALAMHKVYFDFDRAQVKDVYMPTIEKVAALVPDCAAVEVAGYTDSTGSPLYNQWLSEQRAQAGLRALIRAGADRDKLVAKGYGLNQPLAKNSTKQGRSQNRRVEFAPADASAVSATTPVAAPAAKPAAAAAPTKVEPKNVAKPEAKAASKTVVKDENIVIQPGKASETKAVTKADTKASVTVANPATTPSLSIAASGTVVEVVPAQADAPWWERFRVAPVTPTMVTKTDVTITAK